MQRIHSNYKKHFLYKCYQHFLIGVTTGCLVFSHGFTACANEIENNIAVHQALPIQSNEIESWPTGPIVSAESAILIEAQTGTILYEKNIHQKQYPASTTKILTTLIASERCKLDEMVTFSHDAVFDIDRGSNHIAIDEGEKLTMEQCLNAILIRSANEVSLAVAEHISGGDWEEFAPIMNARAKELGCLNSNFVNPNGLPNEEHYTTAYDLAMIGKAFFANEMLCNMTLTQQLHIPPSEYQPDDILEWNSMGIIPTGKYAYEYIVGCKTGYTNDARSTLVSCAEKNGMKLICVVLKDESPNQYEDTIALFEYGFNNFDKINVSQTETKYNIANTGSFYSENDIFGSSKPILSLNSEDCIILPKTITFEDTISTISYETENENQAALITYSYEDIALGTVSVDLAVSSDNAYSFDVPNAASDSEQASPAKEPSFIFVNIVKVILWVIAIIAVVFAAIFAFFFFRNYHFPEKNDRRTWKRNRKKRYTKQPKTKSISQIRKEQIRQAKRRSKLRRGHKFRDYDF
ncbi:MAG: D-alanyl-D-alanine carboxypeptidase [Lachnospiraceae bacterium]|nr:D-alanyl-D-alanine carboxypeptidase [Lachnospiraceae bacterium]